MPILSVVILSALFVTTAVMCLAMSIAWFALGKPRHARSWALSYGLSALQSVVNALAIAAGRPVPLMALAFFLLLVPAPLFAIGARQRVRLPTRWRWFAGATVVAGLFLIACFANDATRPIGMGVATLFSGSCLFFAAAATRPRGRRAEPAERAMIAAIAMLASFEAAVGVLTYLTVTYPDSVPLDDAYHAVLAIGIPPSVVCLGVAAILLIACDLAVELGRLAERDPLTGLFNRRGFQTAATRTLANARRLHTRATLVLADIDHFKAINDRYGHSGGDHVLCFIADKLTQGVRQGDLVARIGGEEFALLLVDSDAEEAREVVERIRADIEGGLDYDGAPLPVTVSFGVGDILNAQGEIDATLALSLDRADRALYLSKIQGRNRVTVAS